MKPGRNDPCSCGSGKKYKHCCQGKIESGSPGSRSPVSLATESNQLIGLFNAGRYAELESKALILVKQYPNAGHIWMGLGLSLQMQGKDALHALQKTVELMPGDANAHNNLANTFRERGQLDSSVASCRRALKIQPDLVAAHNNLGLALLDQGQPDAAVSSFRRALEINPDFAEAHSNLGLALTELGQFDAALVSCRRALQLKPDFAAAHNNLGGVLREFGQLDAAITSYRRALEISPNFAKAHNNLGIALEESGHFGEAEASYHKALQINPGFVEAHSNLGNVLKDLGQHDAALASYRRALELKPDFVDAQTNLLFTLNYTAHRPEYCLEEARKYGRIVDKKVTARFSSWQCTEKPERLKVGLVWGDLHNHPVVYFLESLLAQIDSTRIELIAYPTDIQSDELTVRIKPYFNAWKPLIGKNDEVAARLIYADRIHVLLDLSGHTAKNRLPIFAWKPAPVQASWLGYFATTGVAEMDYLVADEVGVLEAQRKNFSETLWYLPDSRLCFTAPKVSLAVASLPALKNGYLTFACFQNLSKVGNEVLTVWGKILTELPHAKLRWQCKQLGDPAVVQQLILRLQQQGIDLTRVSLHGAVSREAYLTAHAEVDMILDTFPYPGGTTTCEALWMGVPTLTLAGNTFVARQGASLLTAGGLKDWVATSATEYLDKAIALASDLPKLSALRAGLREQVSASPLFDAQRFARNFEDALWGMWKVRSTGNTSHTSENLISSPM
jgi:protein O-GlcNAc transferase